MLWAQRSAPRSGNRQTDKTGDQPRARTPVFVSTSAFTLFDYFRVPYDQPAATSESSLGLDRVAAPAETRCLYWLRAELLAGERCRPGFYRIDSVPLFGHVAAESQARLWLGGDESNWQPTHEVRDEDGAPAGAILQRNDGSILLPFDPNELIANYWTEQYQRYVRPAAVSHLAALARRGYYRARPLLPRRMQMSMRRSFSRVQSQTRFPRWPIEPALHDLYDFLFVLLSGVAEQPIPYLAPWPRNWSWALVLTHDVETQAGYERLPELVQLELVAGYRSSWNFVPLRRYAVEDELIERLQEQGFEVGVHGLYHDGRDVSSFATLRRRLPAIRSYAERWQAKGFRSPGTLRSAALMPLLGFDYDSSYSDTAPFEPQAGGCCTWLPYMIGDLVELPITLPQDHTLFEVLGQQDETTWIEKARFLRDRGGMALLLTHPDYVGNGDLLGSYQRVLEEFGNDPTAWKALPHEISDWWRRRSKSTVEEIDGQWRITGPAEGDGRIDFMSPQTR
jgi:hypothetical protein